VVPPQPAARPPQSGPLPPEAETWLRRELDAMRVTLKAEILHEVLQRAQGALAPAAASRPGHPAASGKTSVICAEDPALGGEVYKALADLGYVPEMAPDARQALRRLGQVDPAVVVVDQVLGGDPQAGSKILDWLNRLPGPRRRAMFVAYVSGDLKTMDTGSAFVCGANLTVNRADAGRFAELFRQALQERDELYRIFTEVLETVQG
jgi:hypothetical protein